MICPEMRTKTNSVRQINEFFLCVFTYIWKSDIFPTYFNFDENCVLVNLKARYQNVPSISNFWHLSYAIGTPQAKLVSSYFQAFINNHHVVNAFLFAVHLSAQTIMFGQKACTKLKTQLSMWFTNICLEEVHKSQIVVPPCPHMYRPERPTCIWLEEVYKSQYNTIFLRYFDCGAIQKL